MNPVRSSAVSVFWRILEMECASLLAKGGWPECPVLHLSGRE